MNIPCVLILVKYVNPSINRTCQCACILEKQHSIWCLKYCNKQYGEPMRIIGIYRNIYTSRGPKYVLNDPINKYYNSNEINYILT